MNTHDTYAHEGNIAESFSQSDRNGEKRSRIQPTTTNLHEIVVWRIRLWYPLLLLQVRLLSLPEPGRWRISLASFVEHLRRSKGGRKVNWLQHWASRFSRRPSFSCNLLWLSLVSSPFLMIPNHTLVEFTVNVCGKRRFPSWINRCIANASAFVNRLVISTTLNQ